MLSVAEPWAGLAKKAIKRAKTYIAALRVATSLAQGLHPGTQVVRVYEQFTVPPSILHDRERPPDTPLNTALAP